MWQAIHLFTFYVATIRDPLNHIHLAPEFTFACNRNSWDIRNKLHKNAKIRKNTKPTVYIKNSEKILFFRKSTMFGKKLQQMQIKKIQNIESRAHALDGQCDTWSQCLPLIQIKTKYWVSAFSMSMLDRAPFW